MDCNPRLDCNLSEENVMKSINFVLLAFLFFPIISCGTGDDQYSSSENYNEEECYDECSTNSDCGDCYSCKYDAYGCHSCSYIGMADPDCWA